MYWKDGENRLRGNKKTIHQNSCQSGGNRKIFTFFLLFSEIIHIFVTKRIIECYYDTNKFLLGKPLDEIPLVRREVQRVVICLKISIFALAQTPQDYAPKEWVEL